MGQALLTSLRARSQLVRAAVQRSMISCGAPSRAASEQIASDRSQMRSRSSRAAVHPDCPCDPWRRGARSPPRRTPAPAPLPWPSSVRSAAPAIHPGERLRPARARRRARRSSRPGAPRTAAAIRRPDTTPGTRAAVRRVTAAAASAREEQPDAGQSYRRACRHGPPAWPWPSAACNKRSSISSAS